jgi:hypothetical protein
MMQNAATSHFFAMGLAFRGYPSALTTFDT